MLSDDHLTKSDFLAEFEKVVKIIVEMQQRNISEIEALKKAYADVVDAVHANVGGTVENLSKEASEAIQGHIKTLTALHEGKMSEVDAKLATVTNGKDADPDAMMEQMKGDMLEPMMQECVDMVEKNLPELGTSVRDSLELLEGEDRLKISAIDHLREELDAFKKQGEQHFAVGGVNTITLQNLILAASGTIDDSNLTFTFVGKPSMVNVNGAFYMEGHGWTYANGAVLLDNPVGINGHIFATN